MEEWKQIIDYPNYSISNLGNVRNDKTGRILKLSLNTKGYYQVNLCNNSKSKRLIIHRLVGIYFIEKKDEKYEIDHIDRNKINNHYTNLRWVTRSENQQNKSKFKNTISKYKGAYKSGNKWRCMINHKNVGKKHLGYFDTEEEAGKAYNKFIIENNLGEFCELNNL